MAATKKNAAQATTEANAPTFTKEHILRFKRFTNRRDLLNALLDDDKEYTAQQAQDAIDNFMKGKGD